MILAKAKCRKREAQGNGAVPMFLDGTYGSWSILRAFELSRETPACSHFRKGSQSTMCSYNCSSSGRLPYHPRSGTREVAATIKLLCGFAGRVAGNAGRRQTRWISRVIYQAAHDRESTKCRTGNVPRGCGFASTTKRTFLLPFLAARPIGLRASGPGKRAAKTWPGTGPPSPRQSRAGLEDANLFLAACSASRADGRNFPALRERSLRCGMRSQLRKRDRRNPASLSAAHSFKRPWIFEINAPHSSEIFGDETRRSAAELEDV